MTRVTVLMSVDENPAYNSNIESARIFWSGMSNRDCVFQLVVIRVATTTDAEPPSGLPRVDEVWGIPVGISPVFAAQMARIVAADAYDADFVLLTDADMLPLDSSYFREAFESGADSDFLVFRDVIPHLDQIPICYVAASPANWSRVLSDPSAPVHRLENHWNEVADSYSAARGTDTWTYDQRFLFKAITSLERHGLRVFRYDIGESRFSRLDRVKWPRWLMPIGALLTSAVDYHREIPIKRFDKLTEAVLRWRYLRD